MDFSVQEWAEAALAKEHRRHVALETRMDDLAAALQEMAERVDAITGAIGLLMVSDVANHTDNS